MQNMKPDYALIASEIEAAVKRMVWEGETPALAIMLQLEALYSRGYLDGLAACAPTAHIYTTTNVTGNTEWICK